MAKSLSAQFETIACKTKILEYENLGTELRIKTSNQEWLENGVPMYQFSILKFYKI